MSVPPTSAANLNVGWDPSPLSASTGGDFDANSLIERTQEVKVDVNDYSRFKDIGKDLEDEDKKQDTQPAAVAPEAKCRNCSKPGAKLKCSVCKKAVYCARNCQASDWQFHKLVTDEPDLPENMRGYKNGLPYFHRELSKEEKNLIGDIAPQKIELKPAGPDPVQHDGSAWNKAGTFEERVVTKWAEDKWKEIFTGATYSEGNLQATLKAPEKISGDASICVVRGKKRYLFDFSLKLPFEVAISGGSTCKGTYEMNDISSDEDYEISCRLTKKLNNASEQSAVQAFVAKKDNGLQKELVRLISVFASEFQQQ
ncbi:Hsp90 protein [Phytophthora nicotianae]|uniref:Hsp90 protein n=1 Tax=Phytophthora nicotianae TaxID=4792 RepID=A0A0W8C5V1_PHYNI|nr:Hsp90 protein [Phytophthora nicotianae]KUF84727.1 Hsp90 protein [Phytophthora nicotianae]